MDKQSSINTMEKQRLRDAIEEQVRRFLDNGGRIEVLDDPGQRATRFRGSAWHGGIGNVLVD